ncbi:hypothetical protein IGI04_010376 [Brassica rapa subsp. trilocularis]|uniref:Uncharacterized protein n=1 Tax=Brassica rapa subsp. trilocularis TaxID=1813537 RepID=A0ABQ7N063_BRACM|nr:hypothetical protein IGI04_010376 [Brassica rapa subsp. trilocularis]
MRKTQLSQQHFSHISNTLSARLCSPPEKSLSAGVPFFRPAPPVLSLFSTRRSVFSPPDHLSLSAGNSSLSQIPANSHGGPLRFLW